MKKIYIAPKLKSYEVKVNCQLTVKSGDALEDTDNDVKGQLENESISIWDLY